MKVSEYIDEKWEKWDMTPYDYYDENGNLLDGDDKEYWDCEIINIREYKAGLTFRMITIKTK